MPEMYEKIKDSLIRRMKKKGKVDSKKAKRIAAATFNKKNPQDPVHPGYDKKKSKTLKEAVHVFSKLYKDSELWEPIFVIDKNNIGGVLVAGSEEKPKAKYEYCLKLKPYATSETSISLGYFDSEDKAEALGKKILKAISDAKAS